MNIVDVIQEGLIKGISSLYNTEIKTDSITMNATRKEFTGDFTVVTFPYTKIARKKPEEIGEELGNFLVANVQEIAAFNVIKGFLNLEIDDQYWHSFLDEISAKEDFGTHPPTGEKVMVEFSSPNTNKPLHLGHIRNILLGWSCSKIQEAAGNEVVKVQIVNDRGIAICKSMLAWQKFGNNETPESTGIKGDFFVGKFYVLFQQKLTEEYNLWKSTEEAEKVYGEQKKEEEESEDFFKRYDKQYFNDYSALGKETKALLLKWEASDPDARELWQMMNGWVYSGFEKTYKSLGVTFDKLYFESNTYLLGKDFIEEGLKKGTFYKKEDGSVWIDLQSAKLDHKLVLRGDGTSVYMTQDLGTVDLRYKDFGTQKMIYVVGDEQNHHFKVLFEIMKRLGVPYADGLHHLSYGMIDLPTGKMKSREGTVVDADELIAEVIGEARNGSTERGDLEDISKEERDDIYRKIGLAALKYFILKVNPQRRMIFNPQESVDLQGDTGPYIQNAYVRIKSVLRKADQQDTSAAEQYKNMASVERDLIALMYKFPEIIQQAATQLDPALVASFSFDLAKGYHRFYHDCKIITAESPEAKAFRLKLSDKVGKVLHKSMALLGIEMPERM
ncbi:MAG: arginyl-tRNA synthetase [Saprospiraceae bacterium]|jgi:arginyl-tRNA synthetase